MVVDTHTNSPLVIRGKIEIEAVNWSGLSLHDVHFQPFGEVGDHLGNRDTFPFRHLSCFQGPRLAGWWDIGSCCPLDRWHFPIIEKGALCHWVVTKEFGMGWPFGDFAQVKRLGVEIPSGSGKSVKNESSLVTIMNHGSEHTTGHGLTEGVEFRVFTVVRPVGRTDQPDVRLSQAGISVGLFERRHEA